MLLVIASANARADDDFAPGLVATVGPGPADAEVTRVDADVQFNWANASPDPRVPADRFGVRWHGKLLVPASGRYRFHCFVAGTVRLSIDGKPLIAAAMKEAMWASSEPMMLEPGHHSIEVTFEKTAKRARIGLYWESGKFGVEPIVPRWLFHAKSPDPEPIAFERGGELVRAFRCAACHTIPGVSMERNAPSLDRLNGRINKDWLVRWLEDPHALQHGARMPAMGLSRDDSRAVARFLLVASNRPEAAAEASGKGIRDEGESLVRSLGCLACHTLGGSGSSDLFGGGSLDHVADKRPAGYFRNWLRKPESVNTAHRMPVFTLSNDELDHLASFLATLGTMLDGDALTTLRIGENDSLSRGKQLVGELRCAACHEVPGIAKPVTLVEPLHRDRFLGRDVDWTNTCVGPPDAKRHRPGFALDEKDQRAILSFIGQLPATVAAQSQFELGRRLLRELNCTSCHARDSDHGLQPANIGRAGDGADDERAKLELDKIRGELEPPSLTSVGDKFKDETLAKLIEGGLAPRRPWLKVRMPRFVHRDAERDAVVAFLVDHDRIPMPLPAPAIQVVESPKGPTKKAISPDRIANVVSPVAAFDPAAALAAGHQLVSVRGFGCMSCHTVGKHQPKNIAVNARGSDLLKIGERVRHEWFLRWTRDPSRIVPGMEMPAITVPVAGVFDGRLDLQIESLWEALNSPSFVVPSDRDTAQQIIALKPGDAPVILRDVMFDCPPGSGWCPRPFAIGLPNRHNVLFDLDTGSLRGWWVGDFARERTEGKSWLWEPAGLPVWDHFAKLPALALRDKSDGRLLLPQREGQSVARLRSWASGHSFEGFGSGVAWLDYTLQFEGGIRLAVEDRIGQGREESPEAFWRSINVDDVPPGYVPVFLAEAEGARPEQKEVSIIGPLGATAVRALGDNAAAWQEYPGIQPTAGTRRCFGLQFQPRPDDETHAGVGLAYIAPDVGSKASPPASSVVSRHPPRPIRLDVVPGFEAIRLPLDNSVMPTALAVRQDSRVVVASLKGAVFSAKDSDGDGLEDMWHRLSDHLAAPFGVLADEHGVFVSHKPELVQIGDFDIDLDHRAVSSEVIASGWGHTEDYHDWTFGIVKDAEGKFIIATASDYAHKDRPKAARKLRGRILRVSFDGKIDELARGARYPTGLAMNRDGAIFFTDNQGVQNTFNEINHLVPGSRYGVPAQDDPPADKDPWPERAPAIQIPHPWMRSINGICFLESGGKWGPFEGHGIGCEYDTRGLIRFSLQKIGDAYQGACYPFTLPEEQVPQDQRLLGPICCAVSPNGDLYVGGLRDSGWGGGNNVGELVRIKPSQNVPLGIREVRATRDGFAIDFTGPVDAPAAADESKYTISSYHRVWKGTYATPDSDRRTEKIRQIAVAADRRSVVVTLDGMRPGFVYDIHLGPMGPDGQSLWPADAFYTLNQLPDDK